MRQSFVIKLDDQIIGTTKLEHSDPPMGVVFGNIAPTDFDLSYDFIKDYCRKTHIDLSSDYPNDKCICTFSISGLKVYSSNGIEIKGSGSYIEGMEQEGFQISYNRYDRR